MIHDYEGAKEIWNVLVNTRKVEENFENEEKGENIYLVANNDENLLDNSKEEVNDPESSSEHSHNEVYS